MTTHGNKLFDRLADYEQRSIRHEAGAGGQREQHTNWDGVVFRLGDERLTVPIDAVEEILPFPQSTPVPGAKEWLLGLANVRGNLVTIVDLGWFLIGTRTPVTARTRLILTRLQGRHLGLVVDEVFGQRHFHTDDLEDLDDETDRLGGLVEQRFPQGERAWGVFRINDLMRQTEFLDGAAEPATAG